MAKLSLSALKTALDVNEQLAQCNASIANLELQLAQSHENNQQLLRRERYRSNKAVEMLTNRERDLNIVVKKRD